ncbi:MAG TPA: MFS transporter [Roseiflexaceae bacterium]
MADHANVRDTERRPLVATYAGFVGLGLVNSRMGVAWPAMRDTFGLPIDALGVLLIGSMAGYMIASGSSGRLSVRLNLGVVLALSSGITALALLGTGAAPSWSMLIVLSVLTGLGAGAIDVLDPAHEAQVTKKMREDAVRGVLESLHHCIESEA